MPIMKDWLKRVIKVSVYINRCLFVFLRRDAIITLNLSTRDKFLGQFLWFVQ